MRMTYRLVLTAIGVLGLCNAALAGDPASCASPRFADIGWTDVTVTTSIATRVLQGLGYAPKTQLLSVPITYMSLKNKDIDIFLGNWMPTMEGDRHAFVENKTVEIVRTNLAGAKYTMAVPAYVYAEGLKSFADVAKFKDRLGGKIYGLEPGNDGDRVVLSMIKDNKDGLGEFELVESSEQSMLAQLDRSLRRQEPIVFLGWEPHPMNTKYQIKYLDDPADSFGPDNGAASVMTNVRAGYLGECPNVGAFLKNLSFTLPAEDEIMGAVLFDGAPPAKAAEAWLRVNKPVWSAWLAGVTTLDGQPAVPALAKSLGICSSDPGCAGPTGLDAWVTRNKLPVGAWLASSVDFLTGHARGFFDIVSTVLTALIDGITAALLWCPSLVLIAAFAAGAYWLHRSIGLSVFIIAALLLVLNLGYWRATVETLSLVICATITCVVIGVPIGIAAAHRPTLFKVLRPVLDLMQTIPTFVYLIPTLVLFGLGVVPGLISTVIFSIPAPIRLTHLGISSVPLALKEAGEAFGATRRQLLFKVELPCALPTIMAGITQCIMLSLSMVVISALVGADGLGKPVVHALNTVDVAMGFEAGLAIVVLAIILDRVCKRPEHPAGRR